MCPLIAVCCCLQAVAGSLTTDTASTFMHVMQLRNQMRPACLNIAVIEDEDRHNLDEGNADSVPVLQVSVSCCNSNPLETAAGNKNGEEPEGVAPAAFPCQNTLFREHRAPG